MLYALSKVLWIAVSPSTVLIALTLIALFILTRARNSRTGFMLLSLGVSGLAVCTLLPVGTWLLRPLEERFPPINFNGKSVDGIILLGGAIDLSTSTDRGTPTLNLRAARIVAFVDLARRFPRAQLLITGGNPSLRATKSTEAEVTRALISQLGLSPNHVMFEEFSRNTHENAVFSWRLAHPRAGRRWLLVTSAADMPRAVGCFRAVGWPVIPVPVDYHTERHSGGWAPGLVAGLEKVDWAVHEWLGLFYYRLRGWTPTLFPAPIG